MAVEPAAMESPPLTPSAAPAPTSSDHQQLLNICTTNPTLRFQLELEFVELLSNPFYLQYLAHSGYIQQPAFTAYIHYLQYWHTPAYSHYIQHPSALHFLRLLHTDGQALAEKLLSNEFVDLLHVEQYFSWRSYKFNRYKEWEGQQQKSDKVAANANASITAQAAGTTQQKQAAEASTNSAIAMDTA